MLKESLSSHPKQEKRQMQAGIPAYEEFAVVPHNLGALTKVKPFTEKLILSSHFHFHSPKRMN